MIVQRRLQMGHGAAQVPEAELGLGALRLDHGRQRQVVAMMAGNVLGVLHDFEGSPDVLGSQQSLDTLEQGSPMGEYRAAS